MSFMNGNRIIVNWIKGHYYTRKHVVVSYVDMLNVPAKELCYCNVMQFLWHDIIC